MVHGEGVFLHTGARKAMALVWQLDANASLTCCSVLLGIAQPYGSVKPRPFKVFAVRAAAPIRPSAARAALDLIGAARFAADTWRPSSGL